MGAFDGLWVDQEGIEFCISGKAMHGPDGTVVPFTFLGIEKCTFETQDGVFEGTLSADSCLLKWNDGDVWTRPRELQTVGKDEGQKGPDMFFDFDDLPDFEVDDETEASVPADVLQDEAKSELHEVDVEDEVESTPLASGKAVNCEESGNDHDEHSGHSLSFDEQEPSKDKHIQQQTENWGVSRTERLWEELQELQFSNPADRRKRLRALQLELHPDKQPVHLKAQAQHLFLIVQCEWEASQASHQQSGTSQTYQQAPSSPSGASSPASSTNQKPKQTHPKGAGPQGGQGGAHSSHGRNARRNAADHPAEPEENFASWDDVRIAQAAAAWRSSENQRLKEERSLQKHRENIGWNDVRKNPNAVPVELHIFDPLYHGTAAGIPLHTLQARRTWTIAQVKEALEGSFDRFSMRLTAGRPNKDNIRSRDLEDHEILRTCLPAGNVVDVTLLLCLRPYDKYDYVFKAVARNWRLLQFAPSPFRSDRTLIRAAVQQNGMALQEASSELRSDVSLVLMAIKKDGAALEFVQEALRDDWEIVLKAARSCPHALQFASATLRRDRELVLSIAQRDPTVLMHVDPELLADRELFSTLVQEHPSALQHASLSLRSDRQLAQKAIRKDPMALQHVAPALRNDREVVRTAVQLNFQALMHASPNLRMDPDLAGLVNEWYNKTLTESWDTCGQVLPSFEEYQAKLQLGKPLVF